MSDFKGLEQNRALMKHAVISLFHSDPKESFPVIACSIAQQEA